MLYCISNKKRNYNTAGVKAPDDILKIAQLMGAKEIPFFQPVKYKSLFITRLLASTVGIGNWNRISSVVKSGDVVILQHPNENILVANKRIGRLQKKGIRFIGLIHDLDSIRKSFVYESKMNRRNLLADEILLKKCDVVICHNESMIKYLLEKGFDKSKLVSLEIFDYLHDCPQTDQRKKSLDIIVAGNLMPEKCRYLYKLMEKEELSFRLQLYGPNFCGHESQTVVYNGVCKPEELPAKLKGSFGLVWDGEEIDGCAGNAGEYIKYNNPHKCSLFLASGLPVIIWKEAALAPFIENNGVGVVVNSLTEIRKKVDNMSEEEYEDILKNVMGVGEKMKQGFYFSNALKNALEKLQ